MVWLSFQGMEVCDDMKNVPARKVSSNLCGTYVTRKLRFRDISRKGSYLGQKQTRLKYNRSMFARTKDELTELCLRSLMDVKEVKEKVVMESIEPAEGGIQSIIRLSHKFEVPVKRGPTVEIIEIKSLTSWEPLDNEGERKEKQNEQEVKEDEQPREVPLNDVFREDPVVLRKLLLQYKSREIPEEDYEAVTSHQPYPMWLPSKPPNLDYKHRDIKNYGWHRVPKDVSYVSVLPLTAKFYTEGEVFYYSPPGMINEWVHLLTFNGRDPVQTRALPRIKFD